MDKTVISDTSCLISLNKLGLLHLLKLLYDKITITPEVKLEWGKPLPNWFIENHAENKELQSKLEGKLGKGEASSIVLALEQQPSIVIIDEIKARKIAQTYNLEIIGTLGILILAFKNGSLNNLENTLLQLKSNGFRVSDALLQNIIESSKSK
ncbi:DUF3368 domain-containing protein [Aequorivita todarodis]|uniref:DUF3368 domain-containing protein n=1 Tax=Aequorivita todarodis TaxID=2036821 RepID=UPI0023507BD3|nr:DUF3368 domain-containing protein [Aequorivita todarodis]MDC8000643.1 DUF3368 domain-containing protein [Aequorivita todarodis]